MEFDRTGTSQEGYAPAPEIDVEVRGFEPMDRPFLFKTWLKCYRHNRHRTSDATYYDYQDRLITRIFQRPTARIAICCDTINRDFIVGFLVGERLRTDDPAEPLVLHFGFTKLTYRNLGVMQYLLRSFGWMRDTRRRIMLTHWTHDAYALQKRYNLEDNPYLLMELK